MLLSPNTGRFIMNKQISGWQTAGFVFTSIFGTLLHFLYEWSKENLFAGLFSAVNESIWEHMKLIYFPILLFALIESHFVGKDFKQFWCVKLLGMITALTLIPVLFYTYTGISGTMIDWLNISIFFIATGAAYWLEAKLFKKAHTCRIPPLIAISMIVLIGLPFMMFTFKPPHIPFFQDPVTGTYGMQ